MAYRNAGWEASDAICQYTLDLLGESRSDFQHTDRNVTFGSGFVATVMGITGASSESLALFAASDALYDAWSQNFEEYAFIAPSSRELAHALFVPRRRPTAMRQTKTRMPRKPGMKIW